MPKHSFFVQKFALKYFYLWLGLTAPAFSHEPVLSTQPTCGESLNAVSNYTRNLRKAKTKLKFHLGVEVGFKLKELPAESSTSLDQIHVSLVFPHQELALTNSYFSFLIDDQGTASFEFFVQPQFRKYGISSVVQAFVLMRHKEIKRIDDRFIQNNLSGFMSSLLGKMSEPDFSYVPSKSTVKDFVERAKNPSNHPALRAEVLEAYRSFAPTGRTNENFGFRNMEYITVNFFKKGAVVDYAVKYGKNNENQPLITIVSPDRELIFF